MDPWRTTEDLEETWRAALLAYESSSLETSRQLAMRILEDDPDRAEAWLLLACISSWNRLTDARDIALQEAYRSDPTLRTQEVLLPRLRSTFSRLPPDLLDP